MIGAVCARRPRINSNTASPFTSQTIASSSITHERRGRMPVGGILADFGRFGRHGSIRRFRVRDAMMAQT
jgi:hypothetical protein